MARGRARLEWDQTSLLWATLAEPNRDTKERQKPFTPADVHPFMATEDVQENDGPDWALWSKLTRNVEIKTIDLSKLNGQLTSD